MMVGPLRQTRQAMPVFGTYRGPVYGHEHRVLHPPGQLFSRDADFAGGVFDAAGPEERFDRLLLLWSELCPILACHMSPPVERPCQLTESGSSPGEAQGEKRREKARKMRIREKKAGNS